MFTYPAACDVELELLEMVTMALVALEGERPCKLGPHDRARCTLVYLRKHDTFEQLAAGFGIGVATAWRYVNDTIERLAAFAPSLTEALTSHHADSYVLLDGTVAETGRVAAAGHFSGKVRREGVNLQVITAEEGRLLWLSPALPGGIHDVKAAREHGIIETCAQLDLVVLADKGYQGACGAVITPIKRRPDTELPDKHKKSNRVHASLRAPVERTISRIKQWRIFRHARTSPNRLTSAAAAILTLMTYT
ncbi:IS5/IS1182 family transposase [Streptomyces sp. NRRL B-1347]|uniref:IS5/IS1182 family transposase n=1 Tax=Streptomyces sp. NRRL B-1347 TaxID=1476877 RepID=UPI0004C62F1A|nr:IS5/IS1182 family transposase [Streptomyces sp. NRRL B-1347]